MNNITCVVKLRKIFHLLSTAVKSFISFSRFSFAERTQPFDAISLAQHKWIYFSYNINELFFSSSTMIHMYDMVCMAFHCVICFKFIRHNEMQGGENERAQKNILSIKVRKWRMAYDGGGWGLREWHTISAYLKFNWWLPVTKLIHLPSCLNKPV